MSNEKNVQKRIEKAIAERYPNAWIFHPVGSPYQMTGVPDILAVVEGRLFGLEVKHQKPGESLEHAKGRASPAQLLQLKRIKLAGGYGDVVTSVEESLDLIRKTLQQSKETGHADKRNH